MNTLRMLITYLVTASYHSMFSDQLRKTSIPEKTKAATAWGINIYQEWASNRQIKTNTSYRDVTTPLLEMLPKDLAYWMGIRNS